MSNKKVTELRKMLPPGAINAIAQKKGVTRNWVGSVFSGAVKAADLEEYIRLAEAEVIAHLDTLKKAWQEYQAEN
jgi:hypothetical protein